MSCSGIFCENTGASFFAFKAKHWNDEKWENTMKQQKNMILRAIWIFMLCPFISPAWSLGFSSPSPMQLSLEDANALTKLISYPKPKLKNRQWLARGYVENGKRTRAVIDVESDYYEQDKNHKRYYKVFCHTDFDDANHWECGSPDDVIEIKDDINNPPILLEHGLSSKEVLRVFDFIKQSGFFLKHREPIYILKKEKGIYKVRIGSVHTIGNFDVIPTKHGSFLPIDLENIGIWFRD